MEHDSNTDFEENSPYQESLIPEIYQRPDELYFQEPPELPGTVSKGKLAPKQAYVDKILKIIQRKVLKGTYLPVTVKQIKAGYFFRPHF